MITLKRGANCGKLADRRGSSPLKVGTTDDPGDPANN